MSVTSSLVEVADRPVFEGQAEQLVPGPKPPRTFEDTGLSATLVADLILKALYVRGTAQGGELARYIRLPFQVIEHILVMLKDQKSIEVVGGDLLGPVSYRFTLTDAGRNRARLALQECQYVGPAPVPIEQYTPQARLQSVRGVRFTPEQLRDVLSHLVLPENLFNDLGPAVVSGRSILIYGPPGSGKTAISKALGELLNRYGGGIWIPYSLLVENSVITLYDPHVHRRVNVGGDEFELEGASGLDEERVDARWVAVRRPVVIVGGELTLDMLELRYSEVGHFYQAPLHLKANGGVFLIDDFGRQIVSPRNLLNRWILPLEERQDFLTLATGKKVAIPFEQLILFSTNLEPKQLADEAFLRRIRHKIQIRSPNRTTYETIFRRTCEKMNIRYDPQIVEYLYCHYYNGQRIPRSSDPRDLLEIVESICRFRGIQTVLTEKLIEEAAEKFFGEF